MPKGASFGSAPSRARRAGTPISKRPQREGYEALQRHLNAGFIAATCPHGRTIPGPPVVPRTARSGRDQLLLCCAERSSPVWVEQVPDRERHRGVYSPVCPCVPTAAEANVMAPQRRRTMGVGWCGVGRPCETHTHLSVQGGRTWRSACSVCSHTRGDLALQPPLQRLPPTRQCRCSSDVEHTRGTWWHAAVERWSGWEGSLLATRGGGAHSPGRA